MLTIGGVLKGPNREIMHSGTGLISKKLVRLKQSPIIYNLLSKDSSTI